MSVTPSLTAVDLRTDTIAPQPPNLKAQEARLTLRSPGELLAMRFNEEDRYIENRILSKGQIFTLLGPGGIGKSTALLQLAICLITGRPFLGWNVTKRRLKWLILQAENSNFRLQADLKQMLQPLNEEERRAVEENLLIHTIEKDHDTLLSVGSRTSAERIAQVIKEVKADVVAFDPLYAFAVGSLNSDAGMLKTCQAITEIVRLGNPDSAIVILHHSLTGKAGAAKATGLERSSFGRGSKALHSWTRGQINLAPANPEDNTRLVVSCGKNSNGPEFQPFGILMNPETRTFEVDPEFDLEDWKMEIAGETASVKRATPEAIAELIGSLPLSRKELNELIQDEFGCGKSSAYNHIIAAEGKTIRLNSKRLYEVILPESSTAETDETDHPDEITPADLHKNDDVGSTSVAPLT